MPTARWMKFGNGLLLAAILVIAAIFRFWKIASWPYFIDEDSYGVVLRHVMASSFFRGFWVAGRESGKPVFLFWLRGLLWPLAGNPIVAGRWLSAASGVVSTWLCYLLGKRFDGRASGLVAAFIYASSPWTILQDRQDIADPALTALVLGSLLLIFRQITSPSLPNLIFAAILCYLAICAKASAVLLAAVPPLATWLYIPRPWPKQRVRDIGILGGLLLGTFLIMKIAQIGADTTRSAPFSSLGENLQVIEQSIFWYMSPGVAIVAILGAIILLRRDRRTGWMLPILIIGWSAVWILAGNFAPSRYYLPSVALCGVLSAIGISRVVARCSKLTFWHGRLTSLFFAVILAVPAAASVRLVRNILTADLTDQDDWQYRSGWPAGYAYMAAAEFLQKHVPPGSEVGYLVDIDHKEAAGIFSPPAGSHSLGLISSIDTVNRTRSISLYLMIDDGRRFKGRHNVDEFLRRFPQASEIGRFHNPYSEWGVSIVVLPPAP
jgi:4-amino-4-deoxy-L-arabinose transferase-like glycosyltransferase